MKKVTITHVGKLTVSGYGTVNLGDCPLSSLVATALDLDTNDYEEFAAEVALEIKLLPNVPIVRCSEC